MNDRKIPITCIYCNRQLSKTNFANNVLYNENKVPCGICKKCLLKTESKTSVARQAFDKMLGKL
jgi:hypothetical protein